MSDGDVRAGAAGNRTMSDFFQDPPRLGNQFLTDRLLRRLTRRHLPEEVREPIEADLTRFGERVTTDILEMAEDANANEPRLVPFDPWGRRIDDIVTSRGWKELERVSAEEGLVSIAYEREHGPWSRLHQFAKLYLFSPSSAIYTCPLAMTDGAARLIEASDDAFLKERALPHLVTRDPKSFWTSGQWMTERTGGSDVGRTMTVARKGAGANNYRLDGVKWFTSATTAPMAMTLARIEEERGGAVPGSRGLSLFYLETRGSDGRLQGIEILRLKDKLGTRAMPTAELRLSGLPARLVGEPGQGVKRIATLMNITRVHNAVNSISALRRGLALAKDYARRREAFGRRLCDHPLHVETLAQLDVELAGGFALVFHLVSILGKDELGLASENERSLARVLTPLAKLFTAKQAVAGASELLEAFGGAGYIEDTGLPRLLRDAQVLSIWEGTTNILSLDIQRALSADGASQVWFEDVKRRIERIQANASTKSARSAGALKESIKRLMTATMQLGEIALDPSQSNPNLRQASARQFAYSMANVTIASLLLEDASEALGSKDEPWTTLFAQRWCDRELVMIQRIAEARLSDSHSLVFGEE